MRTFTAPEIREVFGVRRVLESAVGSRVGTLTAAERVTLAAPLDRSEAAASAGDFRSVLELNLQFHRELVCLVGNSRLTGFFDGLLAEIRLILASLEADVAGPWLTRNRELLRLLDDADAAAFVAAIAEYLDRSEDDLLSRLAKAPPRR